MSLSEFKVISKLGEGVYSTVFRVIRIADKVEYAMKQIKLQKLTPHEKVNALNEVQLLAGIKSRFIISYK